jgi:hypothetical protein
LGLMGSAILMRLFLKGDTGLPTHKG